jgi:hypothetical protein
MNSCGRLMNQDKTVPPVLYLALLELDGERWKLPIHGMPIQHKGKSWVSYPADAVDRVFGAFKTCLASMSRAQKVTLGEAV